VEIAIVISAELGGCHHYFNYLVVADNNY